MFSQAVAAEAAEGEALEVRERRWKMGTKPSLVGFWLLELKEPHSFTEVQTLLLPRYLNISPTTVELIKMVMLSDIMTA